MSGDPVEDAGRRGPRVRLLEADPELGRWLDPADRQAAAPLLVADTWTVGETGRWLPPSAEAARRLLGWLVLSGIALRRIGSHGHQAVDVLGRGDLLRPWDESGYTSLPVEGSWQVVAPLTVAELDTEQGAALGRHPQLVGALLERAVRRSRWLALQQHIATIASSEQRVLMVFWHLAERWGDASAGGSLLRLPLSHAQIAAMVGARRAAVANALRHLERQNLLQPRSPGTWWLDEELVLGSLSRIDPADCSRSSP